MALALRGLSFSDIEREVNLVRRAAVVHDQNFDEAIRKMVRARMDQLGRRERDQIALRLAATGISQRQVHELTGVSRDTIRKKIKTTKLTDNPEEE